MDELSYLDMLANPLTDDEVARFDIGLRDVGLEIDVYGPAVIANRALSRSERVGIQPSSVWSTSYT